jgi:HK97 family phage major capsid protein
MKTNSIANARQWFSATFGPLDPILFASLALAAAAAWLSPSDGSMVLAIVATSNLKILRQRAADIHQEMRELNDTVTAGHRAMTDAERTKLQTLKAQFEMNKSLLAEAERQNERERHGEAIADADDLAGQRAAARVPGLRRDAPFTGLTTRPDLRGLYCADLFGAHAVSDTGGFATVGEYLETLDSGRADSRLVPAKMAIASGSDGPSGGFAVPSAFAAWMLDGSLEGEIVRPRAHVTPLGPGQGDSKTVSGWDVSDSSSSLFGGFVGQWLAAGAPFTETTPKMRAIVLHLKKLGLLTSVVNELLRDAVSYETNLGIAFQKALGFFLDSAYLVTGTGVGMPLSILNAPATITVSKEAGQDAGTIWYENLVNMFARMHPASIANSVWLANSTTIPQISTLVVPGGLSGSHVPVMSDAGGKFKILTREVIFTEKLPALGARGDIMLVDLSKYEILLGLDLSVEKSGHVGFTSDTSYFRGISRTDGEPSWNKAYTPVNGNTLSPFVTLAART